MPVLSFRVLYFGPEWEFVPGNTDDEDIPSDCHEECTAEFDSCWDSCDPDDLDCHDECAGESDRCDDLCDDLDFDPWDEGGDWHIDYETCASGCDSRLDTCLERCIEDDCEDACFREAEYCEQRCIDAEDEVGEDSEEWTLKDWKELEDELRNK